MVKSSTEKIVVIPDNIGQMGGTRSFLMKLITFHKRNKISTVLAIQGYQLDASLQEYCLSQNTAIIKLPKRGKLFCEPYFSLFYDIYIFLLVRSKVYPALILASIGTPRLLTGLFFFRTPLIYYIHTYPTSSGWKSKAMNLITKYLVNPKQNIVTVSKYSKNKINRHMSAENKFIDVVYNSTTIPSIKNTASHLNIILTVGHVVAYKNPYIWYSVVKEVVKRHSSAKFIWVGEGPLLEDMRKKVIKDHLTEKINFTGLQIDMERFYQKATIYFQPSLIENHSIAIIEAMSYALPCIASNIGGIPESITDNETGFLCNPQDIDRFSDKICYLLKHPEVAKLMGRNGRMIAKSKFNESIQEKSILAIYNRIFSQ